VSQYVELHAHSYFSLLDGASPPDDLLRRARELGMDALALTDHDTMYGAVPFVKAAREIGIRPSDSGDEAHRLIDGCIS